MKNKLLDDININYKNKKNNIKFLSMCIQFISLYKKYLTNTPNTPNTPNPLDYFTDGYGEDTINSNFILAFFKEINSIWANIFTSLYYNIRIVNFDNNSISNYRLIVLYSDNICFSHVLAVVYIGHQIILFDSMFGIFKFENEKDFGEFIRVLKITYGLKNHKEYFVL